MIRDIGVHGPDDTQVIGMLGGVMEQFADFQTGLTVPLKSEWGPVRRPGLPLSGKMNGNLLSMPGVQRRFAIEGVHMGRAPVEEDMHHPARPTRKLG